VGAAAVEVGGGHMDVTVWQEGSAERVIRKH
jgi:cell division ATPase FtsA